MAQRSTIWVGLGALVAGLAWLWSGQRVAPQDAGGPALAHSSKPLSALAGNKPAVLPAQIERDKIEPAIRDPFSMVLPPLPPAPPKPKVVVQPPPAPPPVLAVAAPTPPPLNLRFVGRMTAPDGQLLIFATLAEVPITLFVGQSLSNGYKVDSISNQQVQLSYPPLGTTAQLQIPEPPRYEIR